MPDYLVGPDGLRVEPVQLMRGAAHWLFARIIEPTAQEGEVWYRVTRHGQAVGFPGYYQLDQLQEIVDLSKLRGPDQSASSETA
ncbi:hypothetical protein [Nonomuraea sp. NPDC023979]|uniref:hypothetical protein n=1 Tax=Nonomuraea sp. NPDC023979 TaxID=3154796 RepID=UPI0033C08B23